MNRIFSCVLSLVLIGSGTLIVMGQDLDNPLPGDRATPNVSNTTLNGSHFVDYTYRWSIEWNASEPFDVVYTSNEHGFRLVRDSPDRKAIIEVMYLTGSQSGVPFSPDDCMRQLADAHNDAAVEVLQYAGRVPVKMSSETEAWMEFQADDPDHTLQFASCTSIDAYSAVGIWARAYDSEDAYYTYNGWVAPSVRFLLEHLVIFAGGNVGTPSAMTHTFQLNDWLVGRSL